MQLTNRYIILLLSVVVLGVYYPALFGEINSVDDVHIIDHYGINSTLTIWDVLMPGGGYYYRPLVGLSYFIDNLLWGMDESFMHLENIALHLVNTILLFLAAKQIAKQVGIRSPGFPLVTALVFALHPINTEAVSWIAGRTDPLAAVFVLLSLNFLLKALSSRRSSFIYLAAFLLFFGVLAKEVALFFVPGALCIALFGINGTKGDNHHDTDLFKRALLVFAGVPLAMLSLSLVHFFFKSGANSMARLFEGERSNVGETSVALLKAFGFYVKKLVSPYPQNFAIVSVSEHYAWLGLAALIGLGYCFFKRRPCSAFVISVGFVLIPALLVAVTKITWTPYAERYLYVPSIFFTLTVTLYLYRFCEIIMKPSLAFVLMSFVLVPFAFATVERNKLWQHNLALYEDTVNKSPRFGDIRNEYALALLKAGDTREAARQLEIGMKLPGRDSIKTVMEANLARLRIANMSPDEARVALLAMMRDYSSASADLLDILRMIEEGRLMSSDVKSDKEEIARGLITINNELYNKTGNHHLFFRNGHLFTLLGDRQKAAHYFKKAYEKAPETSQYKEHALHLYEKLQDNENF